MDQNAIEMIVNSMGATEETREIQQIQTAHRLKLATFWDIQTDIRILEIGCGQGDTTATLAYLTGEKGHVHGIDIGPASYGAPVTLGESADRLKKSPLGKQINMQFDVNILSDEIDFPENSFDCVVLSHCAWYFQSVDELKAVLRKVKPWGKQLCFSEWDANIESIEQYAHFLAVHIQAQWEAFRTDSVANVRTLMTPQDFRSIMHDTGWEITHEKIIHSPLLQDGEWEVDYVLTYWEEELTQTLPTKLKQLIRTEIDLLRNAIDSQPIQPLSIYALTAK